VSWALGLVGSYLPRGTEQDLALTVSSLALVMAAGLLAALFARRASDVSAVGFALVGLGEIVQLAGGPPSRMNDATLGNLASGFALFAVGLLLVSLGGGLPAWLRGASAAAAIPFAIHTLLFLAGANVSPMHGVFSELGYLLLTVTSIGWTITVLRGPRRG
jgi:hypothetical protein